MDFDSMKYAELRSIAKELGLKANVKADKLLKAIKQHYEQEQNKEEQEDVTEVPEEEPVTQDSEEDSGPAVFVNTRRGKGNGTKRKISDTAAGTDVEVAPSAAEDDTKEAEVYEPCEAKGAKKRKVSSTKDSDQTEAEPLQEQQTADSEEQQTTVSEEQQTADSEEQPETKDEAPVVFNAEKAPKVAKAGRIPRYQGTQQKNKQLLKPVTPNFKKLHEAHFNRMESIDSYVQRKTKQMETYKNSVKELKKLVDKTKLQQAESKPQVRVNTSRVSMLSPAPVSTKAAEDRRRHTMLSASKPPTNKSAVKDVAQFRPSVLSTRRINVRFSEATHDNEYKRSLVKTPARMSPCVTSSTPLKPAAEAGKPSVKPSALSASKTPATFVFTGNTSTSTTPGTQKKTTFDLKASLSRPLGYKPHTGKLKPFGDAKENAAADKSLISTSHQKNYKQHQVQTRGDRRAKQAEDRKQKKAGVLGARRGLVMM
ncbi:nucleolar and spindle-associated protein 1 [Notolabrus celidotus]|uniref:nucleolar and spindle-associated protein 1 n=1 Tax=Notolabrus celidotus TaxID=1203425 RepID=UPI00149074EF|nr:nucleolar and spindle-associated protein 1 [Notolabrus celidotus]